MEIEINEDVLQFIIDISNELEITRPNVEFDYSNSAGTSLARLVVNKKGTKNTFGIVLNASCTHELDIYFAIAHELRHEYQIVNGYFRFDHYKNRDMLSLDEYNMQFEEIDANAFAYFTITHAFLREPLFNGLNPEIVKLIKARAQWISDNEYEF